MVSARFVKKNCQTGLAVMRSQVLVHSNVFFFFFIAQAFLSVD